MIFEEREKFIFNLIKKIKGIDFVVIGGYAVNAYTLPRFSIDCDFVVKTKEEGKKLQEFFELNGFNKTVSGATQSYKGNFIALKTSKPVKTSIDILVESVFDRITETEIPAKLIFQYSKKRIIYGKGTPIQIETKVVNPEMLFYIKCIPARKSDIRDCFMLSSTKLNKQIFKELKKELIVPKKSIEKIIEITSKKQFINALQGIYGKIPEEQLEKTKHELETNLEIIKNQKKL